jgi:hypothetical protein
MNGVRLQSVKTACLATLDKFRHQNPKARVALITFDDSVYIYNDGIYICSKISIVPQIENFKRKLISLREINSSFCDLRDGLSSLVSQGGTKICGPLFESISIANEVVLCTDGEASDANIQYYDELINFAKINRIKINVISFDDASCQLSVLGKFANETGGVISRSANVLDLETTFSKIATSSVLTDLKFKLIFNKQQILINNLNKNIEEIVSNKNELWTYNLIVTNSNLKHISVQLQIEELNRICVLTVKRDITQVSNEFVQESKNLNLQILHAYVISKIKRMIIQDGHQFSIVNKDIEIYQNLYKLLKIVNIPNDVKNLFDLVQKNNQISSLKQLSDENALKIYNLSNDTKRTISFQVKEKVEEKLVSLTYEEKILLIQKQISSLSTILNQYKSNNQITGETDLGFEEINSVIVADKQRYSKVNFIFKDILQIAKLIS